MFCGRWTFTNKEDLEKLINVFKMIPSNSNVLSAHARAFAYDTDIQNP
jgi:hypothetical protein